MTVGHKVSDIPTIAGVDFVYALFNGTSGPLSTAALSTALAASGAVSDSISAAINTLNRKPPVVAVATENVALTGTQTIESVALTAGDRVLLTGQADATENGIYVVAAGAWARATDADSDSEMLQAVVFVIGGTLHASTTWICTGSPELGVDDVTWIKAGGLNTFEAAAAAEAVEARDDAVEARDDAEASAIAAAAASDTAVAARDVAVAAADSVGSESVGAVYVDDTTAGLAATAYGGSFLVATGDTVALYLNDDGTAVLQAEMAQVDALDARDALYGLGEDSAPQVSNIDTWYRGGLAYGYGGSHPSATPGANPFPSMSGLFFLTTVASVLGDDESYIHQSAFYDDSAGHHSAHRQKAGGAWLPWRYDQHHFLSRVSAGAWCAANTPPVGTEISIYQAGAPQSVVRLVYVGSGEHFPEADFDGWVPVGDVSLEHFGAYGNGSANDTPAAQAAVDYVHGLGGGTVYGYARRYRMREDLVVKRNVFLKGPHEFVGMPGYQSDTPNDIFYDDLETLQGALAVDANVTIILKGGAGVSGFLIYRHGMTMPAANDLLFFGTAITVDGDDWGEDDVTVERNAIFGFNRAIDHIDGNRPHYYRNQIDCINGIRVSGSKDTGYISGNHAWPFTTVGRGNNQVPIVGDDLLRNGRAYEILGCDWCKLTDNFAFGYLRGFHIEANSVLLIGNGADNHDVAPLTGSVGFYISAHRGKMIGCQAAGHDDSGVRINNASGQSFSITNFDVWGTPLRGIFIERGAVSVSDSSLRTCSVGIAVGTSGAQFLDGGGNTYESCGYDIRIDGTATDTSKIQLAPAITDRAAGSPRVHVGTGTFSLPTIASASTLNLPAQGDKFLVSGTNDITDIAGGWAGREVTLVFLDALDVSSATSGATKCRLYGDSTLTTSAGMALRLDHTGSYWTQTGGGA